ncbi:hypothetical protein AB9P05_19850 [Roseivirga sp. BDSF3-8]|uniref:hypothetical protein n=1 Tax=Roseivirga sp. BDSF3-8 TaxID=3241598 RepID=UPI0035322D9E
MMKRFYSILFCLLLTSVAAQAQVPGFMGKRAYFTLDLNPTPALANQNVNNTITVILGDDARYDKQNVLAFNYRPQVNLEYLVGERTAIGLNYSLLQTGTMRKTDKLFGRDVEPDVLRGTSVGLNVRFFNKGESIAPIGLYQNIKLEYTTVNTYDDKASDEPLFTDDFNHFVFTYGIGRQKVVANAIVLRIGLELGYAATPKAAFEPMEEYTPVEEANYNVHRSMFGYYIFSIKLGIGSLLF